MANTAPNIDEYLRERLMPVEGAVPHIPGIEMFGNSIPAGTVGGVERQHDGSRVAVLGQSGLLEPDRIGKNRRREMR